MSKEILINNWNTFFNDDSNDENISISLGWGGQLLQHDQNYFSKKEIEEFFADDSYGPDELIEAAECCNEFYGMLFDGEITLNVNGKEMNINEKDLLTAELLEIGNSVIDQPDSYAEVARTFSGSEDWKHEFEIEEEKFDIGKLKICLEKFNVLGYEFKGVVDVEYDGNASETEISDSGLENDRTGIIFYEKTEKGFKKSNEIYDDDFYDLETLQAGVSEWT